MTADRTVVEAVRTGLAAVADPAKAAGMQAYMKSAMPYLGANSAATRNVVRAILADPDLVAAMAGDRSTWRETVLDLWDGAVHREERYVAVELTGARFARGWQDPDELPLYQHLVVTGAWWDHVDAVAVHRVGPLLRSHPDAIRPVLEAWAVDPDLWLRRTAIIAQVGSKAALDTGLLTLAIDANLDGRDFFIRKAIGWALRQHARVDPDWVRAFVAAREDLLSGLSKREARKHL